MRSLRPRTAGVVALLAPVLTAASIAAAAPGEHHRLAHLPHKHEASSNCQVSIDVAPHTLTARDPVVVFGRVVCANTADAADQTVDLLGHLSGPRGYSLLGSAQTDDNGFYEFTNAVGVVSTGGSWFVRYGRVRSATDTVKVAARVTLSGPPEGAQLLSGAASRVTFTGQVDPADVGSSVILQRQDSLTGGTWHRIDAIGTVGPEGRFTIVHTFTRAGAANIRVVVGNRGRLNPHNVPSPSNILSYEISEPQNPHLTIEGSPNPILAGQSVTIGGTLVGGGAGKSVALLAGGTGQQLAAVAKAMTGGGGKFTFPAQSPARSTFYRVRGVGRSSAILYIGVRDVLTATVSATSVPAGQPLTFSGTVAPEHDGHLIYLEALNASGSGFHAIELGTVGAGSSYSIVRTCYDAGTHVFRVSIPGGPENEGVASPPFTVDVVPAPPSTLTPEAPGNSGLPVGGQF